MGKLLTLLREFVYWISASAAYGNSDQRICVVLLAMQTQIEILFNRNWQSKWEVSDGNN
jgi:hypothetical protein